MSCCLLYSCSTWCTKEISIDLDHFAGDARGSSFRIERRSHRVKRGWGSYNSTSKSASHSRLEPNPTFEQDWLRQPLKLNVNFRFGEYEVPLCVESDGSEKLEADIPASCSDSLFSKPPQSGMAEERIFMAILTTGRSVSGAELHDRPLSGGVITRSYWLNGVV